MNGDYTTLLKDPRARRKLCGALTMLLFCFNVLIFEVIEVGNITPSSGVRAVSRQAQRYDNMYHYGEFKTDEELFPIHAALRPVRSVFWGTWGLMPLCTILYTPIVIFGGIANLIDALLGRSNQFVANSTPTFPPSKNPANPSGQFFSNRQDGMAKFILWQAATIFLGSLANDIFKVFLVVLNDQRHSLFRTCQQSHFNEIHRMPSLPGPHGRDNTTADCPVRHDFAAGYTYRGEEAGRFDGPYSTSSPRLTPQRSGPGARVARPPAAEREY
ncbi:MAG TPA: hypothetical protein VNP04_31940 [Alphaproteobacteria bacterium]|nr:hypothetical protein [Alphaproteobacteria bacterium]